MSWPASELISGRSAVYAGRLGVLCHGRQGRQITCHARCNCRDGQELSGGERERATARAAAAGGGGSIGKRCRTAKGRTIGGTHGRARRREGSHVSPPGRSFANVQATIRLFCMCAKQARRLAQAVGRTHFSSIELSSSRYIETADGQTSACLRDWRCGQAAEGGRAQPVVAVESRVVACSVRQAVETLRARASTARGRQLLSSGLSSAIAAPTSQPSDAMLLHRAPDHWRDTAGSHVHAGGQSGAPAARQWRASGPRTRCLHWPMHDRQGQPRPHDRRRGYWRASQPSWRHHPCCLSQLS